MDRYGVDMCILHPAFGMSNDLNRELVEKYPDKFRALVLPKETTDKAMAGEIEWTIEAAVEELDRLLSTGKFIGIGEGMPSRPHGDAKYIKTYTQTERMDELRKVMDVAKKHKVPVRVHTGSPMGYQITYTVWPENWHPNWIRDLAAEYPDVPIIYDHGGMQGGRSEASGGGVHRGGGQHDQRVSGNGHVLDRAVLQGPVRSQCGSGEAHVGDRLGREHPDPDPDGPEAPDLRGPGAQARDPAAPVGHHGVEPEAGGPAGHLPGRHEPDPGRECPPGLQDRFSAQPDVPVR